MARSLYPVSPQPPPLPNLVRHCFLPFPHSYPPAPAHLRGHHPNLATRRIRSNPPLLLRLVGGTTGCIHLVHGLRTRNANGPYLQSRSKDTLILVLYVPHSQHPLTNLKPSLTCPQRVVEAVTGVLGAAASVGHEVLFSGVDLLRFAPIPGLELLGRTLLSIWDAVDMVEVSSELN